MVQRFGSVFAAVAVCAIAAAQTTVVSNPATTPVDRLSTGWWAQRHEQVLARVKANSNASLVLLGDSITQNYEKNKPPDENFLPIWERFYAPRGALTLGFSGDRTEHVLWRLEHGEVDGLHPRAVAVLIGTNNTAVGQSPVEVEAGIDAVVGKLRDKLPQSAVLLLGILPNEISEKKAAADREINLYLSSKYAQDANVIYLDVSPVFFKGGALNTAVFYDPRLPRAGKALHPDTVGQLLMAEAMEPALTRLLQDSSRQYLAGLREVNTAVIPAPRLEMDSYDWYERHAQVLAARAQVNPKIVLIGDSITHFWGGLPKGNRVNGPLSWQATFGSVPTLNLGFGWDRTQNVLWRLAHGEFDGLHPSVVVLNIGTNNLTGTANARSNTPAEIVEGILAIHETLRMKSPESRIVVMGVFPRGVRPDAPLRNPISEVNRLLSQALSSKSNTTFLDIGKSFLAEDGTLPVKYMNDGTHPTEEGYRIWAAALLQAGVGR